jgi:hypothetical protein
VGLNDLQYVPDGSLATEFALAEAIYLASLEAQAHDPFTCSVGGSGAAQMASVLPNPRLECLDIASASTLSGLQSAYLLAAQDTYGGDAAFISDGGLFGSSTACSGRRVGDGRINAFDLAVLMWTIFEQPPYGAGLLETWTIEPRDNTATRCGNGQTRQQYGVELQEDFCAAGSAEARTTRALSVAGTPPRALSESAAPRSAATTVTTWNVVPGAGEWTRIRLLDTPGAPVTERIAPVLELFLVGVGGGQTAHLDPEPPPTANCTGAACAPSHDEQRVSIHFSRREDLILDAGGDPSACSTISQAGAYALGPGGVLSLFQNSPTRACPFDIFVWVPQTIRDGLSGDQADTCAGAVGVGHGSSVMDGGYGAAVLAPVCATAFLPPAPPPPPGNPPLSPPFVLVTTPWMRVDLKLPMPAAGIGQSALNAMRELLAALLGVPSSFIGAEWEDGSTLALVVAVPRDQAEWTSRGALQIYNVTQLVDAALNSVGGSIQAAQDFLEQAVPNTRLSLSLQPEVTWLIDGPPPSPPLQAPPPLDASFLTLGLGSNATLAGIIAAAAAVCCCCCCCCFILYFRRHKGKLALRKDHPLVLPGKEARSSRPAPPLDVAEPSSDSLHDRFDSLLRNSRKSHGSRADSSRRDSLRDSWGGRSGREEPHVERPRPRPAAAGSAAGQHAPRRPGPASVAGRTAPGGSILGGASRGSSANVSVRSSRRLVSAEDGSYVTSRDASASTSLRDSRRRISDADAYVSLGASLDASFGPSLDASPCASMDASQHDIRRLISAGDPDHDISFIRVAGRRPPGRDSGAGPAICPSLDRLWSVSSAGSPSEADGSPSSVRPPPRSFFLVPRYSADNAEGRPSADQPPRRSSLPLSRLSATDNARAGPSADYPARRLSLPLRRLGSSDEIGGESSAAGQEPRFCLPLHKLSISTEAGEGPVSPGQHDQRHSPGSYSPQQHSPGLQGQDSPPHLSPMGHAAPQAHMQRVLRGSPRLSRSESCGSLRDVGDDTVALYQSHSHRQTPSPPRRRSCDSSSRDDGLGALGAYPGRVGSPLKGTSPDARRSFGALAEGGPGPGHSSHHDSYRLSHQDDASRNSSVCGSPGKSAAEVVARSLAAGTDSSEASRPTRTSGDSNMVEPPLPNPPAGALAGLGRAQRRLSTPAPRRPPDDTC